MGKMINLVIILIIMDILFLVTGQMGQDSLTSLTLNAIENPESMINSTFYISLISGNASGSLTTLAVAGGVIVGSIVSATNIIVFLPMGLLLALLLGDFLSIYGVINAFNPVLSKVIMAPIFIIFVLTVIEWIRGKD